MKSLNQFFLVILSPAATDTMPVGKKAIKKKAIGKKSAKKGLKGLQSIADLLKSVRHQYEVKCKDFNSYVHPDVKKLINQYAESNSLLAKVSKTKTYLLTFW